MTISVRKADFSEIFKIRDLASVTIPTSYQNNLTTEQIDYLEDFLYAQQTLADSQQSKQVFLIASLDGKDCAYGSFTKEGPDLFHLQKIFVNPDDQKKGLGSALFKALLQEISNEHPEPCDIELNINHHNQGLKFYEKMGMKEVRIVNFDIGNGFIFTQKVLAIKN